MLIPNLSSILDILKIEHLFSQSCLKFVCKFKNSQLPTYFYPFNVYLGPRFIIMTLETLVKLILFIPVPTWQPNASDPNFR